MEKKLRIQSLLLRNDHKDVKVYKFSAMHILKLKTSKCLWPLIFTLFSPSLLRATHIYLQIGCFCMENHSNNPYPAEEEQLHCHHHYHCDHYLPIIINSVCSSWWFNINYHYTKRHWFTMCSLDKKKALGVYFQYIL